ITMTSAGVWMIFFGYGFEMRFMMPIGRQCASGLSLLLSPIRFFTSSAAHGWYGAPPSTCAPTFPNTNLPGGGAGGVDDPAALPAPRPCVGGGLSPSMVGGAQPVHGAVSHTPDRSGLPSAVRGAGAFRSGFPSAVFGTPGV